MLFTEMQEIRRWHIASPSTKQWGWTCLIDCRIEWKLRCAYLSTTKEAKQEKETRKTRRTLFHSFQGGKDSKKKTVVRLVCGVAG